MSLEALVEKLVTAIEANTAVHAVIAGALSKAAGAKATTTTTAAPAAEPAAATPAPAAAAPKPRGRPKADAAAAAPKAAAPAAAAKGVPDSAALRKAVADYLNKDDNAEARAARREFVSSMFEYFAVKQSTEITDADRPRAMLWIAEASAGRVPNFSEDLADELDAPAGADDDLV